jgi:hypothetical protein
VIRVSLSSFELRFAAYAGIERRINAIRRQLAQLHGADSRKQEWQIDIQGAIAEFALAKHFNRYWEPVTNGDLQSLDGDVQRLQIRSTTWSQGHLFIHDRDKKNVPFILAIVTDKYVDFVGWVFGKDGCVMGDPHSTSTGITYWVKQSDLYDMDKLPKEFYE